MTFFDTPSGRINVTELPASKASGRSVLCIHGFCCDARVFSYAANRLAEAGYDVYGMDLPGHGMSAGPRGDMDFGACLRSINLLVSEIRKKSSKVFLLAHSMGSTFALWYAHQFKNSVDGLILLSPYIRIPRIKRSDAEPETLAFLYLLLGRIFTPRKQIDVRKVLPGYVRIGGTQYARMASAGNANFDYSFRYLIDIVAQRNSKLAELSDINLPVLILYGLKDRNVFPQVSVDFFRLLKSKDKTITSLDCNHWFYDAIFYSQSAEYSEDDRKKFMDTMTKWLDLTSARATP